MRYARDDIQQRFEPATWERGLAYFEQGRVDRLRLSASGDLISGRVRGRRSYATRIQLRGDERRFYTHCSCPVGRRCKHSVALLLAGLEARRDNPALDPDLSDWVDDLFRRHQQDTPPTAGEISYQLSLPDHPEPHLAVQCLRHHRLGTGPAVGRPLSLGARLNQRGLPATDRGLIKRLGEHADESPLVARLCEPGSGQLLDELVRSRRCHWEGDTRALSRGPKRKATAQWRSLEDGSQELQLRAGGAQILPVDPLRYYDAASGRIGRIDSDLNPAILPLLARAPRVAAHQIEEFTALLDQRGLTDIPRPRPAKARMLPACAPQPRLELMHLDDLVEWHHGFVPDIHIARLTVAYHGHRCEIAAEDAETPAEITRQQDGELLSIVRDPAAEAALLAELPDFHRLPVPGNPDIGPVLAANDGAHSWLRFLQQDRERLRRQGWQIEERESFSLAALEPDSWELKTRQRGRDWFDLSVGIRIGEDSVALLPLLQQLAQSGQLPAPGAPLPEEDLAVELEDGRLLRLPPERLADLLETLGTALQRQRPQRDGSLRLHRQDLARMGQWQPGWQWRAAPGLRRFVQDLAAPLPPPVLPTQFGGSLRAYQGIGLAWLQRLSHFDLGGVLADDMGLGKTIQTLAHLAVRHEAGAGPSLIVAPTSVLGNWRAEAQRFTPQLRCALWHGPGRQIEALDQADLVVTSYATLMRDLALFTARTWDVLVIDEAQMIKNPGAKISQAVRRLEARQGLCLTGTPVENHLGELWSLFDFLAPGFLGDARQFNRLYRVPIERRGDEARGQQLRRRIAPFLLRRRKDEVARELPPKSVMLRTVTLGSRQADLYETLRASLQGKLQQAIASRGLGRSQIEILEALLKLRQACCDPRLLKLEGVTPPSAKLQALLDMLPELIEDGRRILLFSQFTQMLDLIAAALREASIDYLMLTGRSRKREALIRRFQEGEVPLFLISLKAGGTGLNLTAADTVIHFDPWWNPAVENQATDRAHRIGQDKPVFVYKLLCADTVEERIQAMQERKQALADQVQAGAGSGFSEQDLELLLKPLN